MAGEKVIKDTSLRYRHHANSRRFVCPCGKKYPHWGHVKEGDVHVPNHYITCDHCGMKHVRG